MDCGGITIGSDFQSSTSTDVTRAGSFLVDVDQPDTGPSYRWTHSRSKGSSSSRLFTLAKVLLESLVEACLAIAETWWRMFDSSIYKCMFVFMFFCY